MKWKKEMSNDDNCVEIRISNSQFDLIFSGSKTTKQMFDAPLLQPTYQSFFLLLKQHTLYFNRFTTQNTLQKCCNCACKAVNSLKSLKQSKIKQFFWFLFNGRDFDKITFIFSYLRHKYTRVFLRRFLFKISNNYLIENIFFFSCRNK